MASFAIEGFPTHHRVLHVKQEVAASEDTVMNAVMKADIERASLLNKEKELLQRQEAILPSNMSELNELQCELESLYQRMEVIGAKTAESRIMSILSGLQFTDEMINQPTLSLSGGWRMRVSLAAALFITP